MTTERNSQDQALDRALGALGPDLPEPTPSDVVRHRITDMVDGVTPMSSGSGDETFGVVSSSTLRSMRRFQAAVIGLAACVIGLLTVAALTQREVRNLQNEIARLEQAGAPLAPPQDPPEKIKLVDRRLALVNMDHDTCPIAAKMTPWFKKLSKINDEGPVKFINLDLSKDVFKNTLSKAKDKGFGCVFDESMGADTGIVKLVDLDQNEVVRTYDLDQRKLLEEVLDRIKKVRKLKGDGPT